MHVDKTAMISVFGVYHHACNVGNINTAMSHGLLISSSNAAGVSKLIYFDFLILFRTSNELHLLERNLQAPYNK
jgi:hypothetical protein